MTDIYCKHGRRKMWCVICNYPESRRDDRTPDVVEEMQRRRHGRGEVRDLSQEV